MYLFHSFSYSLFLWWIPGSAALGGLEISHTFREPLIVLLTLHQNAKTGTIKA